MTGKLVPFGYGMPNAAERLEELMQSPRAVLVDIRYHARSPRPGWSGAALELKYGDRYKPLSCLGNPNHANGQPMKIDNPGLGIPLLLEGIRKGYTLILMCGCREYEHCHRRLVCEMVRAQLPDVEVVGVLYEVYQQKQEAAKEKPVFGDSTWIERTKPKAAPGRCVMEINGKRV